MKKRILAFLLAFSMSTGGFGMMEAQCIRPQCDLACILQRGILSLPHQGQPPAGKLDPDLMGPAGDKMDLHKAQAVKGR